MKAFAQGSAYNDVMSTIGDLAMVNVAWAVCCLPVVTAGASTGALYDVARAIHDGDDAHVLRRFAAAFRRRIGTSIGITVIIGAFWALALFDLWYLTHGLTNIDIASLAYGICATVIALVAAGLGFVFPLMSRSDRGAGAQIRRSFAVAIAHPLVALAILALNALPFIVAMIAPGGPVLAGTLWGIVLTGCTAWVVIALMKRSDIID
ncbi:transferase [Bifidobacterium tissieri]|uniref:Transferase n=1 Tax=Bifidobacterium tissieri TaxID=1630162 RepID=A0A261FDW6_9BIFI|nr:MULTISPECIES: DUF624 domain-containing protein [Bifidobacterium]OZG57339.1 transferase [Bifidobacterium tissieri]TPF95741.1 hypothetical protein EP30_10240 [Bifidobacterium sp. UTCIF-39]